ncbi:MAG: hypothetical protein LUD51_02765, partial [Clostridia bacterium]|nr:hypothetical protein [Clostridia bacterium]
VYDSKTGYFKNPLAKNLEECIHNGQVMMNGRRAFGAYTYVLDMDNNIIFGKRYNPNKDGWKAPHPTLIGGLNPEVQCAGMIYFYKGRILWFNGNSGHYKPSSNSLLKVEKVLDELRAVYPEVFHKRYMGAISG